MKLNQGPISEGSLMEKLVTAKKLIDMTDSQPNKSNKSLNESSYNIPNYEVPTYEPNYDIDDEKEEPPQLSAHERVLQSRLPENIKKAMIEKPINHPGLNETLDMSFVNRTKKLMEQEGVINKKPTSRGAPSKNLTNSSLVKTLTPIIENIIKKTLDKIVEQKLEKILLAQESVNINENLVLKVGKSIFKGKITEVKKTT